VARLPCKGSSIKPLCPKCKGNSSAPPSANNGLSSSTFSFGLQNSLWSILMYSSGILDMHASVNGCTASTINFRLGSGSTLFLGKLRRVNSNPLPKILPRPLGGVVNRMLGSLQVRVWLDGGQGRRKIVHPSSNSPSTISPMS